MSSRVALALVLVVAGIAGRAGRAASTSDRLYGSLSPNGGVNTTDLRRANRFSELAGVAVGIEGRPWPGCLVAVVPGDVDPQLRSRGARLVRADRGGEFTVGGLPAGSYLVTASPDVNPATWLTPGFLDRLGRISARVTLEDREKKSVTLPCARLP